MFIARLDSIQGTTTHEDSLLIIAQILTTQFIFLLQMTRPQRKQTTQYSNEALDLKINADNVNFNCKVNIHEKNTPVWSLTDIQGIDRERWDSRLLIVP